MKELIEYLKQNKIYFKEIDDNFIEIDSKKCFLVRPTDGVLFSEDFILIADENCDRYVYCFGGNWYWEEHNDYDKPKLNELRYIGSTTSPLRTDCFLGIRGGYELLNGSRTYEDWIKKAKFMECKALGICEKNTLAGVLKFQLACQKESIKSIIGATYTIFREDRDLRYDIKIYVQNQIGWQNLLLINKEVNVINSKFVHEKRFFELLEGLIIVIDPKSMDFDDLFPLDLNDVYYQLDTVEFSNNDSDKRFLLNLKKFLKSDLQPIAITDAFYLEKEHSHIKKVLNNVGSLTESISFNQYFKDKEDYYSELEQLFNTQDESFFDYFELAVKNETKVSNKCDFKILLGDKFLPKYEMTEEEKLKFETNEDLFWNLIEKGLEKKIKKEADKYIDRVEKEFVVIKKGGFIDYFLILWDIIRFAKENGILSGIGRGSAGGSLIAYLLDIIKLDPLEFDLLFERFMNEGRIGLSLPDIDTDFPGERRNEIKRYMESRYNIDQVCSVGTYTTLKIKAALKELGRQYSIPPQEMNYITTVLDLEKDSFSELFSNACEKTVLKKFILKYPELINTIPLLLKQPKTASIHACATLILPKEKSVFEWIPVKLISLSDGEKMVVTEWEGVELDAAGFLKEDILGIQQLDKFQHIINLIFTNHSYLIDLESIPYKDDKVFDYFCKGWNSDVFHFGSKGLTGYCKMLQPRSLNDLIAGIALYRPGTMENNFHNEYVIRSRRVVERKAETEPIEYDFGLEEVTKETYGIYCVAKDSLVLTDEGEVLIQNIQIGSRVLTEDGTWQLCSNVIFNGQKPIFQIRTNFGRELKLTADHKVLTQDGWKQVSDLQTNDLIKGEWIYSNSDSLDLKDDLKWLVGLFLADGHSASTVVFYCESKMFAVRLKNLIEQNFPSMLGIRLRRRNNGLGICWSVECSQNKNKKIGFNVQSNELNTLLRNLNLFQKTRENKVWQIKFNDLHTIAGILEGDSCLKTGKLRMKNESIVRGVFEGLQSHRIHSSFFRDSDGFWCCSFCDWERKLPFRFRHIPSNCQLTVNVPRTYLPLLKYSDKDFTNHSRPFIRRTVPSIPHFVVLRNNATIPHITWGKVLSVKSIGEDDVFDLSVEKNHSFVCEGHVIHNCYQEQIMQAVQVLGGFSLTEADDIRRAMGKKKQDLLDSYKNQFVAGAVLKGCPTEEAGEIWSKLEKFASYSFNKCISGDEKIKSSGTPYKYIISEMWKLRNVKGYHKKLGLNNNYFGKGYGNSFSLHEDRKLRKNKIKDIRYIGIEPIYRLTLSNGASIDVTSNHKFPTSNGEKKLKDIFIKIDKIYFNEGYFQEDTMFRFTDKGKENNYHKNKSIGKYILNSSKGVEGFIKKEETFLKPLKEYNEKYKKNHCERCSKTEVRFEIHHKDFDHGNNEFNNLETLCISCHKKEHYKKGRLKTGEKGLYTSLLDIKSIQYLKDGEVYDIEMENPYHTFVNQSGVVTSNSHAAAYAITGHISQWFKVNYPLEFWSTAFKFSEEKDHANYISEINLTGNIKVMPADINKSRDDVFTDFETKTIYWPLISIKQCGDKAASQIIEVRDRDGEYFSFEEFLSRNKFVGSKVNKSVIENLIISGAFDNVEKLRTYNDRMKLVDFYRKSNKIKVDSDKDLFSVNHSKINEDWWWTLQQKQLSGIAFFDYDSILKRYLKHDVYIVPVEDFQSDLLSTRREKVKVGGYIVEVEEKSSKKGKWCRILLESNYTFIWVTIWNEQYKQIEDLNLQDKLKSIMLISGEVVWDTYRKENILQANNDTEILVLD